MTDPIRISREELFAKGVGEALARERRLRGRPPEAPPISPLRAFLLSPLFYLPAAGMLGALLAWLVLEPRIEDYERASGEIRLVQDDPFDLEGDVTVLTVGTTEVVLEPGSVVLESGADGQPPFASVADLEPGVVVDAAGFAPEDGGRRIFAMAIRPATPERAATVPGRSIWPLVLLFPLTAALIALTLLVAEGVASRNRVRMVERSLLGALLALLLSLPAFVPAGIAMTLGSTALASSQETGVVTVDNAKAMPFLAHVAGRSVAWACIAAALGVGMNLIRSTKVQLRNSAVGGALGGALGGMFFDPIDRFLSGESHFTDEATSRLVGLLAVGFCVGLFVALAEQLAREAWVRVRTGPLAGKSFVLYRTPTIIGSAPAADIYLFKDAEIMPRHAAIHRVGNRYEVEDLGSRAGVTVGGRAVRRHRLASGEQVVLGATVLEFEERAKKPVGDHR